MWLYEKKLQYPVRIRRPNPKMAAAILSQYGGPDGELAASLRYISQRHHMPIPEAKAMLNDIGTEELAPQCYHKTIFGKCGYNTSSKSSSVLGSFLFPFVVFR